MRITFHGAAGSVTGSRHLVEAGGRRILLDCGLFQGRRSESYERNSELGFDPATVDAIVLSHAHIDHAGCIPCAVRRGFDGPIFTTAATQDLAAILLFDSARIHEADSAYLSRKNPGSRVEPLYTTGDAAAAVDLFHSVPYGRKFEILPGIHVRLLDAGHILGSAQVELTDGLPGGGTLLYSGDVGRRSMPILRDPDLTSRPDFLLMESTYGGRDHGSIRDSVTELGKIVRATFDRGGRVIVPAFSVGRTQDILYHIRTLFQSGSIPAAPVFVDSPLSTDATGIYRAHPECFDAETREILHSGGSPFSFDGLEFVSDVSRSKMLNSMREPMIVISASGMCEHGRIVHHLSNGIGNPANTILLVGFMASHTLGRRLADGASSVRIFGEYREVRAAVEVLHGFSAHAGASELVEYAGAVGRSASRVILVHGEPDETSALASRIESSLGGACTIPGNGETVDLDEP
jgi:metallo-beta-lactamase family protein